MAPGWVNALATLPELRMCLSTTGPASTRPTAFDALPGYFMQRLEPALDALLDAAAAAGDIRTDVSAKDLLQAIALSCQPVRGEGLAFSRRVVAVLADGLGRDRRL